MLGVSSFAVNTKNNMKNRHKVGTVEIVIFRFKEALSDAEAKKLAGSVNDFIRSQPGFISRTTNGSIWCIGNLWKKRKLPATLPQAVKYAQNFLAQ